MGRTLLKILIGAAMVSAPVFAEDIELQEEGAVLTSPGNVECATMPALRMSGDLSAILGEDRAVANRLLSKFGQALAQVCPALEVFAVEGHDRGVTYSFEVSKSADWQLATADAAPEGAAETAATAQETVATDAVEVPQTDVVAPVSVQTPPEADGSPVEVETAAAALPEPAEGPAAEPEQQEIEPGVTFLELSRFFGAVPTVRGSVELESNDTWSRVLAARAYAERPSIIDDDMTALEVSRQMLNPAEFQQFLGPLAQEVQKYRGFDQLSVFDRRDLATRVRTQLKPYLDQRRQTGPIDVYRGVPVQLGEYEFDKGAFPFDLRYSGRNYSPPNWQSFQVANALDTVVLPDQLEVTAEQARQFDAYLRAKQDRTLYLGVFLSVDPVVPVSLSQNSSSYGQTATPASVKQVALFADKELNQMVADFTPILAERQARVSEIAEALAAPLLNGEMLVRSIDRFNGGDATEQAVVDAYVEWGRTSGEGHGDLRGVARRAIKQADAPDTVRFAGTVHLGEFDSLLGGIPVQYPNLQYEQFAGFQLGANLQIELIPQLSVLPMSAEDAAAITAEARSYGQMEMRLDAKLLSGSASSSYPGSLQINATYAPQRVLLFSGKQGDPVAERRLLADVELPETPGGGGLPFEMLKLDK